MRKFYCYLTFLVQIFAALLINSCASVVVHEKHSEHVGKDYKTYLSINLGDKLDKVEAIFGSSGILQFSVLRDSDIFSLIEYQLLLDRSWDHSETFWVVLRNGGFFNLMLNDIWPEFETYDYQGAPASRVVSWKIQDERRVDKVIEKSKEPFSKDYWLKQWENQFRENPAYLERNYEVDPGLTALALLSIPITLPMMIYWQHQEDTLYEKYDGKKIRIGMTSEEVGSIFGTPLRSEQIGLNEIARYYGQMKGLDISVSTNTPFVAVVFKDDRANRIFSGSFFNEDWVSS